MRKKAVWIYLCSSPMQKLQCGVEGPSPGTCRLGCPFMQKRKPGQGLKREKFSKMEERLVDFEAQRLTVVQYWAGKERTATSEGYIMHHICEILEDSPTPDVCFKRLSEEIRRCQLPLFRDYYRKAREDVAKLRKIARDHETVRKMRGKEALLDATRRGLSAGEAVDGVLPTKSKTTQGTLGLVEVLPGEEISGD